MYLDCNTTSHINQVLNLLQRQRSFLSFTQEASKNSVNYKMNSEAK